MTTIHEALAESPVVPAMQPAETTAPADLLPTFIPASAVTNGSPQRNVLKIMERVRLIEWMKIPENTEFVQNKSDLEAAGKAMHELGMEITAGNIIGIRNTIGIVKAKPEKPAPDAGDVDLIALQKQLTTHGQQIETIKLEAGNTKGVINLLVSHVRYLQLLLLQNAPHLTALPESTMAEFKDLKPLAPLQ